MHAEKIIPLAKAAIKRLIVSRKYDKSTGGTSESRYCYSVWLRHVIFAHDAGLDITVKTVAELGPGDSFGIGLMALLTGSETYYALDVHRYWNKEKNLHIFDELVLLLKRKEPVPDDEEFPRVTPSLKNYSFPSHIITDELLQWVLAEKRISQLRQELANLESQEQNTMIRYFIPWNDQHLIEAESVDFIYSQAVLQYVDNLDNTYMLMNKWLKPGGIMSHSIDFSSHGITKSWNGHWLFSEAEWKLIHGKNKVVLNRAAQSVHLQLLTKHFFEVVNKMDYHKTSRLSNKHFHPKFKNLSLSDVETNVMVVQAKKLLSLLVTAYQTISLFVIKYSHNTVELFEI